MWAPCSTWERKDALGSLSIAQSEKTSIKKKKKRGEGREERSHDIGNHLTL